MGTNVAANMDTVDAFGNPIKKKVPSLIAPIQSNQQNQLQTPTTDAQAGIVAQQQPNAAPAVQTVSGAKATVGATNNMALSDTGNSALQNTNMNAAQGLVTDASNYDWSKNTQAIVDAAAQAKAGALEASRQQNGAAMGSGALQNNLLEQSLKNQTDLASLKATTREAEYKNYVDNLVSSLGAGDTVSKTNQSLIDDRIKNLTSATTNETNAAQTFGTDANGVHNAGSVETGASNAAATTKNASTAAANQEETVRSNKATETLTRYSDLLDGIKNGTIPADVSGTIMKDLALATGMTPEELTSHINQNTLTLDDTNSPTMNINPQGNVQGTGGAVIQLTEGQHVTLSKPFNVQGGQAVPMGDYDVIVDPKTGIKFLKDSTGKQYKISGNPQTHTTGNWFTGTNTTTVT